MYELIAGVEVVFYLTLRAFGAVHTPFEFLVFVLKDIPLHLTLGRAVTAGAGLLTIFQTYQLGKLVGGEKAGLFAALLCMTNLTFVIMSSMCKEDAVFWAFSLCAMNLAWRSIEKNDYRHAILAGVSIAAAFCAKYLAVFVPLVILAPLVRAKRHEMGRALKVSLAMGGSALVALFVFFPLLFTDTKTVVGTLHGAQAFSAAVGSKMALTASLTLHLPNLVGWPVFLVAIFEFIRRIVRDPWGPAILMVVPIVQFLAIAIRTGHVMAHYLFPMALACFILAAAFFASLPWARGSARATPLLLAALILADPAYFRGAVKYGLLLTGPRTSEFAFDYLKANARPGDCVAMNHGALGENFNGPDLLMTNRSAGSGPFTRARAAAESEREGPRFFVQVGDYTSLPADLKEGCEWLVIGRRGRLSHVELGTELPELPSTPIPPGYERQISIAAFPEEHSNFAPHPTTLDFDELRQTSIAAIWRHRAMGLHFDIYRASL